jgi:hypothetical protein
MNFDPNKYLYSVLPATPFIGVNVVLVRLETQTVRTFYIANQSVDSVGLKQHMDSLTDELLLEFFEKKKKPKNPDGRKQKEAKNV